MKHCFDIVLVDDDELVHEFVLRVLRRTARQLTSFEDPRLAHDALRDADIRLLIVDTKMPGMSGIALLELLSPIRADQIILCSAGRLDAGERARTRALGIEPTDKAVLYEHQSFTALIGQPAA